MSSQNRFTDEFKRDAVAQVVDRGYAVSEVAERLGVSIKSLYTWKAQFATPAKDSLAKGWRRRRIVDIASINSDCDALRST
ncbi:transposase [Roseovarius azorensis]|uniref:Transposase n=1 Tax=Roseovarius azorensis TaxID=1287727 RepID=A0A1H7P455_9RHOB|nr:transposase [Roseovarius azorensis]SEL30045.1 transposase [Roseovarius azorensis]